MLVVKPRTRLVLRLADEVGRLELLPCCSLCLAIRFRRKRHRARIEPGVEHIRDTAHGAAAGAGHRHLVDDILVEVCHGHTARLLELGSRTKHVVFLALLTAPNRNGISPETLARDRPIARTFEPLPESPLFDMRRRPGNVLGGLKQGRSCLLRILKFLDRHEPGGGRIVQKRRIAAPAVRIGVRLGFFREDFIPKKTHNL